MRRIIRTDSAAAAANSTQRHRQRLYGLSQTDYTAVLAAWDWQSATNSLSAPAAVMRSHCSLTFRDAPTLQISTTWSNSCAWVMCRRCRYWYMTENHRIRIDCVNADISSRDHRHKKLCGRPPQYVRAPCKLTFDLLTLKVVSESRVTWSIPLCQF